MIELACLSHNFNYLPFSDAARLVAQLGFGNIDVSAPHGGGQAAMVADPAKAAAATRSILGEHGLRPRELFLSKVEVEGQPVSGAHPDAGRRERLLENFARIADYARDVGFGSIMVAVGQAEESQDEAEAEKLARETLGRQVALAKERGVLCNFEPSGDPEQATARCRATPGLGLTLDYSHFLCRGYRFEDVQPLHAFTRHMHAKSASSTRAKAYFHNNEVDFRRILADLKARHWEGCIQIECMGFPKYKELDASFQPLPEAADPIGHPPFQTMALAYEIARLLQELDR